MFFKHMKLFKRFLCIALKNMSVFRVDVYMMIFHLIIYSLIYILFWRFLLPHDGDSFSNWHFSDLALLNGILLVAQFIMMLSLGFFMLPQKVLRGEIDKYLSRPIHPLFALILEELNYNLHSAL
jgi:ABC-2 type transport system permease protein